jgi:hypothetical protein
MKQKIDLDSWWDKRYGFEKLANPLFSIYQELNRIGADLDYIDFLQRFFVAFYRSRWSLFEWIENEVKRRRTEDTLQPVDYSHWSPLERQMLFHTIKKQPSKPRSYHHKALTKWFEETIDPVIEDHFIKTGFFIEGTARKKLVTYLVSLAKSTEKEQQETRRKDMDALSKRDPVEAIFREYLFSQPSYKEGRKGDLWGTFFLLAITEHLRKLKSGKPNYSLACKLLDLIRDKANERKEEGSSGDKAKWRIRNLKVSSPEWNRHLKILEKRIFPRSKPHSVSTSSSHVDK